ncbi:GNAT family N-acetyltransferase [Streptomyces atroolivaceus]|uniref:GNAT family N-acetyltransferase n=1 Tax=Streptomyces atroolivaceus TaxID=66869 RepID=UPI002025210D|nr:GNAT family N-acetyltransferase [Streptomyces atroolivaceus]
MTSVPTAPGAPAWIRPTPSVTAVPYNHPDARHLTQALRAEQLGLYGFADDPDATPEADFDPPGLFLVAHLGQEAIGCGGVRFLDEHTGEVKRMYVSIGARGQGTGRQLLGNLEQHAASRGATRIMLETGRRNAAALALYHRTGYLPCPSYVAGRDPRVNRAMTKRLGSSSCGGDREVVLQQGGSGGVDAGAQGGHGPAGVAEGHQVR